MPDGATPHGRLALTASEWADPLADPDAVAVGVDAFAVGFDADGDPLGAVIAAEPLLGAACLWL